MIASPILSERFMLTLLRIFELIQMKLYPRTLSFVSPNYGVRTALFVMCPAVPSPAFDSYVEMM